jgi:HEAT repeat protein
MLLAHELAHVRRHDYLLNLIQTVVETLLFYHPAARWISERAREERENCCDDIAIASCGVDPGQYTTALLVLEEARGAGFTLAAAANGGSLLRRAQRILTGTSPYVELGPRWIAGVITIGAALFTGRDAIAGIQASYAPSSSFAESADSTEKRSRVPDNSRAAPASVTKAPLGSPLAERWRWAEKNAGSGTYWIGYLVGGDPTGGSRYYTSDLPVRIDGNVTITGRMNFGGADMSNAIFYGVPLSPIVGRYSPSSTAIFVLVSSGVLGRRIDRVHLGTFALPQHFDRRPLMWLDSAADGESITLIRSLMSSTRDEGARRDLVAAIGMHRDRDQVTPVLIDILGSSEARGVRSEAAEWLGHSRDARAMRALSGAARRDRDKEVREEAVEAFGHMDTAAATDTLIGFARTITEQDIRRTAIESLAHRADDRAVSYLAGLVRSSESRQTRTDALEALAEMPDGRGFTMVIEFAQSHPDAEIRREAIEEVAQTEPASRALDFLTRIVANDRDESVRAEAAETIAEVHDPRSVEALTQIANRNSSLRVQIEAIEALGETGNPASALPALQTIARSHPVAEARKKALESMVSFRDEKPVIESLMQSSRTDPDASVRREALEALGDTNDPAALRALETIVRSSEPLELREKALDVYANSASAPTAVTLLRSVIDSDLSIDMRIRAVELLEDVDDYAGVPALREVARSGKDQRLRDRATEILNDR